MLKKCIAIIMIKQKYTKNNKVLKIYVFQTIATYACLKSCKIINLYKFLMYESYKSSN